MLTRSAYVFFILIYQAVSAFIKTEDDMKNVLFVIVDDLRHLSAEDVNLTNIAKLTARGVSFKHAYAQV